MGTYISIYMYCIVEENAFGLRDSGMKLGCGCVNILFTLDIDDYATRKLFFVSNRQALDRDLT